MWSCWPAHTPILTYCISVDLCSLLPASQLWRKCVPLPLFALQPIYLQVPEKADSHQNPVWLIAQGMAIIETQTQTQFDSHLSLSLSSCSCVCWFTVTAFGQLLLWNPFWIFLSLLYCTSVLQIFVNETLCSPSYAPRAYHLLWSTTCLLLLLLPNLWFCCTFSCTVRIRYIFSNMRAVKLWRKPLLLLACQRKNQRAKPILIHSTTMSMSFAECVGSVGAS